MDRSDCKADIMVVDDIPENLNLIEVILSQHGYNIRSFLRGKMALKSAAIQPPDLILLDIMMPEMDGFEVCKRLKENSKLCDIPVLFISARSETLDKVKAFKSGAVDYVTKPIQVEEVLARIETHLALRAYQIEIEQKNLDLQRTLDQLKAAQAQIVQSEKMASLGVLTAGIAHEINNPISFISVSTKGLIKKLQPIFSLLQECEKGGINNIEHLQTILQELKPSYLLTAIDELTSNISIGAERTVEIVTGLRAFSRLDQNKKSRVDIHQGIDSSLVLLSSQYKDLLKIKKVYGDIPKLLCFPGRLNQVFLNILKNSIDAIKAKQIPSKEESITIRTSLVDNTAKQQLKVEIIDTGIGIPDNVKGQIYDPFFTTKDVGQGTGLGLSISLGIMESHGGKLSLESKEEVGTTFTLLLPLD